MMSCRIVVTLSMVALQVCHCVNLKRYRGATFEEQEINIGSTFSALDKTKLNSDGKGRLLDAFYDYLVSGVRIHRLGRESFDANKPNYTAGVFLKEFLGYLAYSPRTPEDVQRVVKELIPYVRLDGPGAQPVDGNTKKFVVGLD